MLLACLFHAYVSLLVCRGNFAKAQNRKGNAGKPKWQLAGCNTLYLPWSTCDWPWWEKSFKVQWPDLLSQLLSFDNWLPSGWQWLTWGGAWGVTCAHSRPHARILDQNANFLSSPFKVQSQESFLVVKQSMGCSSLRLVVTVGGVHCRAIPPQVIPLSHNRRGGGWPVGCKAGGRELPASCSSET